jgi:hypothetical protein
MRLLNIAINIIWIALSFFVGYYFYPQATYKFISGFQYIFPIFFLFSLIHILLGRIYKNQQLFMIAIVYFCLGLCFSFCDYIPPDYNKEDAEMKRNVQKEDHKGL